MRLKEYIKILQETVDLFGDDIDDVNMRIVLWNKTTQFDEDIGDIRASPDLREYGRSNDWVIQLVGGPPFNVGEPD